MICPYCDRKIKENELRIDHFLPRSIFKLNESKILLRKCGFSEKNNLLIKCCSKCNHLKHGHIFLSIENVKEYFLYRKEYTSRGYKQFIRDRMKDYIFLTKIIDFTHYAGELIGEDSKKKMYYKLFGNFLKKEVVK